MIGLQLGKAKQYELDGLEREVLALIKTLSTDTKPVSLDCIAACTSHGAEQVQGAIHNLAIAGLVRQT
jgi:predicted transcriptional regulator